MHPLAAVQAILGFLALVCIGVVLRITGLVPREGARPLNSVIIYVGLPAFVFRAVHGASITRDMLSAIGLAWVVFALLLVVALVVSRYLRLAPRTRGGFVLTSALGNTGYIGYPLTAALLGAVAVPVAVFYDVFGTVLQLVLVGFPLAKRFGGGQRLAPSRLLRELLMFPALVAAVVGLLTAHVAIPTPVSVWLDSVAKIVAPLIMLSVGISLQPRAIARGALPLAVIAGLRLVAAPLLALAFGHLVLGDSHVLRVAVLEAGVPSMMLTLPVGERFGLDDEFISAAIFVTTAASIVTVPLAQMLVR